MMTLSYPAPAKINLFLHITSQRADGYHNLQTIFQFLDFSDELTFSLRDDAAIELVEPIPSVPTAQNLIMRAAKALQQYTQTQFGATIHLIKRIPMGSGLGGGSSNAATTLLALNKLWRLKLSLPELTAIGLKLGADVPIFIHGHAAWAEGIGEIFTPIDLPEPWYVIINPGCHIDTKEIYSNSELTRNTASIKIHDFLMEHTHNDFEPLVKRRHPIVATALTWLSAFSPARMTGSGCCIFAAFASFEQAQTIVEQIPNPLQGFAAKGLNRSPAHTAGIMEL